MKHLLVLMLLALCACGGGGEEPVGLEDPDTVEVEPDPPGDDWVQQDPWEIAYGLCAFDDMRAWEEAKAMGAYCRFVLIGKTEINGKLWPSKTWPSDGVAAK